MPGETQPTSPSSSPSASPPASPAAAASATSSAPSSPSPQTPPAPSSAPATPTARPAYVPEDHWDATGNKIKDETKLAEFHSANAAVAAAQRSRELTLPQRPEDYQNALPES